MIFVFESNRAGKYVRGASLYAQRHYGARYNVTEGFVGNSYAIPTKNEVGSPLPLEEIKKSVEKFLAYAKNNPSKFFLITPIGHRLPRYKGRKIQGMFGDVPDNCILPESWEEMPGYF